MRFPAWVAAPPLALVWLSGPAAEPLAAPPAANAAADRIAALRAELEAMHETDQAQRQEMTAVEREHGQNSPQMAELWKKQNATDARNIRRLEEIVAEHGWPKRSVVGERAASAAFLILQHSELSYQKKYLPLARAAVAENEMRGSSLALLEDRILLREGKKQIYGSQVRRNDAGEWEALSLDNPTHVDQRRAAVGLPPLADYLAGFAQRSGGRVSDGSREKPAPDAPPLTQSLFAADDDPRSAYDKLKQISTEPGPAGLPFQVACREFCARFPDSSYYGAVRVLAARAWTRLREPEFSAPETWDPTDAGRDPKINPEQRAEIAVAVASNSASHQMAAASGAWEEAVFTATVEALRPHLGTRFAKDHIVRTALAQPPSRVIPILRELYPDDSSVAAGIRALEQIGRPCELHFTALDGRTIDLRDYRGRVALLVCWAGGSGSSTVTARTISTFKELIARHAAADLAVIGVSFDRSREAAEKVVAEHGWSWPVFYDGQGWSNALAERFHIKTLPCYLLIDRQGVLRFRGTQITTPTAEQRLATLVAEKPPPAAP